MILADEVYGDLAYDGPVRPLATLDLDAAIISYSSLSKAYLAPGWRAGWMAVGATPRLDGALAAIKKLADGRLCSPGPMQYGVVAALTGDRSHQATFRQELRSRAELTTTRLNGIDGISCVAPQGRSMRCREWSCLRANRRRLRPRVAPQDRDSLCLWFGVWHRARRRVLPGGLPCVVERACGIYDDIAAFTREYLDIS